MSTLQRLLAIYLLAVSLAVAINWIATPLYHDGTANYWVWEVLNWFMAAGALLLLGVNSLRKRQLCRREEGSTAISRDYLEVNLAFAASIVLTLWYFWNWFASLNPGSEPEVVGLVHLEWWAFINPMSVLLHAYTGAFLWRNAGAANSG